MGCEFENEGRRGVAVLDETSGTTTAAAAAKRAKPFELRIK